MWEVARFLVILFFSVPKLDRTLILLPARGGGHFDPLPPAGSCVDPVMIHTTRAIEHYTL